MKLSIVIVNYNVRFYLEQCLLSVEKALTGVGGEVFVVDNNSTDDSVSYLRGKFPWVRYIENKENVGFSRANNQAIREARGEYVLLLNPDTFIGERTLRECIDFMDKTPKAGMCPWAACGLLSPARSGNLPYRSCRRKTSSGW